MVTSKTRKIFPGLLVDFPITVFLTAELMVTVKPLVIGVAVVDMIAVGAVVGAKVVSVVPGTVVRLSVGVVIVGELLCTEV